MAALTDVSSGETITSARANEINDRLEQGTGSIYTSELLSAGSISGVSGSFTGAVGAGSVVAAFGSFTGSVQVGHIVINDVSGMSLNDLDNVSTLFLTGSEIIYYGAGTGNWEAALPSAYGLSETSHTHDGSTIASGNIDITGSVVAAYGSFSAGVIDDGMISVTGVTQHEASIDHDALTNFAANEHIDWTSTSSHLVTTGSVTAGSYVGYGGTLTGLTESQITDLVHYVDNDVESYIVGVSPIAFSSGSVSLETTIPSAMTFSSDVTISGSLIVNGSWTTVNSDNVTIDDNEITLNDGEVGAGITLGSSGLRFDRGTSPDALFYFDETTDRMLFNMVGSTGSTLEFTGHTQTASTITDFDTEVQNNGSVDLNTTHRSSDGTDHTYIDQDVTSTGTPTFAKVTSTGSVIGAYGSFEGGVIADSMISVTGVTQHEASIDHDALTNFVGDEHIDWTSTGSNLSTSGSITTTGSAIVTYGSFQEIKTPFNDFWNGTFRESFNALVVGSPTGSVTLTLEQSGTGDLTAQFSDGTFNVDCTPKKTILLTAGTDASPTNNYVYIPQSTKALTVSTSDWPSEEHIKITYTLIPSAGFVAGSGAYINQNWNDHLSDTSKQGHLTHMAERSRRDGAYWFSGVDGNGATSGYLTIAVGSVTFQSTSGVIYQMHKHTYPAQNSAAGSTLLVTNWTGSAYKPIKNLFNITADSTGAAITNNRFFNLVVWGVANKTGTYEPLMINLPGGTYVNSTDAAADVSGYDNYSMPRAFDHESSTGFLIARITAQKTSTTWANTATTDLRGLTDVTAATGGTGGVNQVTFADNLFRIFDETDSTKITAFDVGGSVTTGNTRTLIVPNASGTIIVDTADAKLKTNASVAGSLLVTGSVSAGSFFGDGTGITGISVGAAGSSTNVQVNIAGVTTGDAEFVYDPTGSKLTVTGSVLATYGSFEDGIVADGMISATGVTQHVGAIDHDGTLNFVAAEHIDWTSTTNNLSTSGSIVTTGSVAAGSFFGDGSKLSGLPSTGGGAGIVWVNQTADGTMGVGSGYIAGSTAAIQLTLPGTSSVGDFVRVAGSSVGWGVRQNAGNTIHFGNQSTTAGVTGSLDSTQAKDAVELLCVTANAEWNVISSVGNITIV